MPLILVLFILICISTHCIHAAHPSYGDGHQIHYVGATPDSVTMTRALLDNSPQEFRASGLPRFALVGPSGKFGIGVGGYVKLTGGYDFGDAIEDFDRFKTSEIPVSPEAVRHGGLKFGFRTSRLYVNAVSTPDNGRNVGAFVSVNLLGDGWMPNLDYAYVRLGGIQLGYDYSMFSDIGAMPPTIDYEGPNACAFVHCADIRYSRRFGRRKQFRIGAAIEFTTPKYTISPSTADIFQRAPSVPVYFQYNWRSSSWVRLAAMMRAIQYRDLVGADGRTDRYKFGWGLSLSGTARLGSLPLRVYWLMSGGKAIGTAYQDLAGTPVDLMPSPDVEGELDAVGTIGAYAGVQWNITKRLFLCATFSRLHLLAKAYPNWDAPVSRDDEDEHIPYADQYRFGQYLTGSIGYEVNSWLRVGAECNYGLRTNMNGAFGRTIRAQAMVKIYF